MINNTNYNMILFFENKKKYLLIFALINIFIFICELFYLEYFFIENQYYFVYLIPIMLISVLIFINSSLKRFEILKNRNIYILKKEYDNVIQTGFNLNQLQYKFITIILTFNVGLIVYFIDFKKFDNHKSITEILEMIINDYSYQLIFNMASQFWLYSYGLLFLNIILINSFQNLLEDMIDKNIQIND